jgi:hypothetical protein
MSKKYRRSRSPAACKQSYPPPFFSNFSDNKNIILPATEPSEHAEGKRYYGFVLTSRIFSRALRSLSGSKNFPVYPAGVSPVDKEVVWKTGKVQGKFDTFPDWLLYLKQEEGRWQ